jgi:hypothetical protein
LRENLKALKGTSEVRPLTQRFTQPLSDQENRLDPINKQTAAFKEKHNPAQKQLDERIASLSLEADV